VRSRSSGLGTQRLVNITVLKKVGRVDEHPADAISIRHMLIRIMASRHSAFYSPLLSCIRLLRDEGHEVPYNVLGPQQRSYALLRDRQTDIIQSAVSSNWKLREQGIEPLPVHFAQINQRDGFFIVGRQPDPQFQWRTLEGKTLLADHGVQPLVMLKYAIKHNGAEWSRIKVIDARTPDKMEDAFRAGTADYAHRQGPVAEGEVVASVGASMPPVAFSSLCCARSYQETDGYRTFLKTYERAREWVRTASAEEVAAHEAAFFPGIASEVLAATVRRYQTIGCWEGGIEIQRDLYEQALTVFQSVGAIAWRHRYEEVVG
jgi:NitT/TauT family transport system substrate-binding protein